MFISITPSPDRGKSHIRFLLWTVFFPDPDAGIGGGAPAISGRSNAPVFIPVTTQLQQLLLHALIAAIELMERLRLLAELGSLLAAVIAAGPLPKRALVPGAAPETGTEHPAELRRRIWTDAGNWRPADSMRAADMHLSACPVSGLLLCAWHAALDFVHGAHADGHAAGAIGRERVCELLTVGLFIPGRGHAVRYDLSVWLNTPAMASGAVALHRGIVRAIFLALGLVGAILGLGNVVIRRIAVTGQHEHKLSSDENLEDNTNQPHVFLFL